MGKYNLPDDNNLTEVIMNLQKRIERLENATRLPTSSIDAGDLIINLGGIESTLSEILRRSITGSVTAVGWDSPRTATGNWDLLGETDIIVPAGFTKAMVTISSTANGGVAAFSPSVSGIIELMQQVHGNVLSNGAVQNINNDLSPSGFNVSSVSVTQSIELTGLTEEEIIYGYARVRADSVFNVMVSNSMTAVFYN